MDAILDFVKYTPIPSLLIFVGLILVVLGFINQFGGIEIIPQQRTWAILIGIFLLIVGLIIGNQPKNEICTQGKYNTKPFKDFEGSDIRYLIDTSEEDCINRCVNNNECKGIVISYDNECWLKYKIDEGELVKKQNRSVIIIKK